MTSADGLGCCLHPLDVAEQGRRGNGFNKATFAREFREELVLKTRRLVVIDQNRATGDVLQAVLESSHTEVTSVRRMQQLRWHEHSAPTETEASPATVLVMHAAENLAAHPDAASLGQLPRVIIGRATVNGPQTGSRTGVAPGAAVDSASRGQTARPATQPPEYRLEEMFEFPELLQAIEHLWNKSA